MQNLRAHLSGWTSLAESRVEVGEKTYSLLHPASAEALIDESDFERDERLPYWAEIWPSAVALARHLAGLDLSGKRTIELGCGVGLPTVVALDRGAEVVATDHYVLALDFTRRNARLNTAREPEIAHLDWHSSRRRELGKFDLVLAADVLYERRNVPALAHLIPDLLAPEGEAFITDPRRKDTPHFHEAMQGRGLRSCKRSATVRQGEKDVMVLVHRYRQAL